MMALDLSAINAWILYKEVTGSKINRRNRILQLYEELAAKSTPETENPKEEDD